MVQDGMAWQYKRYSKSKEYAEAEEAARKFKKGLWIEKNPIPPWRYRQSRHRRLTFRLNYFFNRYKTNESELKTFTMVRATTAFVRLSQHTFLYSMQQTSMS